MTVTSALFEQVRLRAQAACEYCGVTENDSAALLTIDHYQPQVHGGVSDLDNLLYCCYRCNLYKADYWPTRPGDLPLWNPRREPMTVHFLLLMDGTLHPISPTGAFTLKRLRLNRPPLVAYRLQKRFHADQGRLLARYENLVEVLERLQQQQAGLLEEHRDLLHEQQHLLRVLLERQTE